MRIVVLSSHTPSLFWFRMDMMSEFVSRGHEVIAVGNESDAIWKKQFEDKGISYYQICVQRNGINPIKDLETLKSIKRILKELNPDKIFTYQAKTVIYGGIAANLLGIKEVYPLIAGMGSVYLSNSLKSRLVRVVLNTEYKIALKRCPAVFFQNNDDVDVFRKNRILKSQKITLLRGSGVNLKHFYIQKLPEKVGFLCVGRLIRDKGIREYLEACKMLKKRYPEITCSLVGPYDSNPSALKEEEIQIYVKDGVINYYGEQKDVRPYLKKASVFVLPSYREGTPKTVLEAMASGRAIITTDAPGCKETVEDGKNGFLIPIKDVNALYEKMCYMVENPEVIEGMAKCGRKMAEDIFDVKVVNQRICETMKI